MTRTFVLTLTLALALAFAAPGPVHAAFLVFNPSADAAATAVIAFGPDGSLSGTIPIASVTGVDSPLRDGQSLAIAGGLLTFAFSAPDALSDGYGYASSTFTITGALEGGPGPGVLFAMGGLSQVLVVTPSGNRFENPVLGRVAASPDVLARFGLQSMITGRDPGSFDLAFAGPPGGPASYGSASLSARFTATVPGPASLATTAIGLLAAAWSRGRAAG